MTKLTINTAPEQDFFQRGRRLARSADRGGKLPDERIVSFEDPADMMQLVTAARLAVFRAVRDRPGSITEISARLNGTATRSNEMSMRWNGLDWSPSPTRCCPAKGA
jgi:predicted transcriptional regulator